MNLDAVKTHCKPLCRQRCHSLTDVAMTLKITTEPISELKGVMGPVNRVDTNVPYERSVLTKKNPIGETLPGQPLPPGTRYEFTLVTDR